MSDTVTIVFHNNGNRVEETVENPGFVDVLLNTSEVAVDGEIYTNVDKVTYDGGDE